MVSNIFLLYCKDEWWVIPVMRDMEQLTGMNQCQVLIERRLRDGRMEGPPQFLFGRPVNVCEHSKHLHETLYSLDQQSGAQVGVFSLLQLSGNYICHYDYSL